MADLYNVPMKDAIESLIEDVINDQANLGYKLTKTKARTLIANALMYNVVSCEVCNQVRFLCGQDVD